MTEQPTRPPRPDTPRMAGSQAELNVSDEVTSISDAATQYINLQAEIHRQSAMGLRKTKNALGQVEQAAIESALIAAGGGPGASSAASGSSAGGGAAPVNSGSGSPGSSAAVTISQVQSPDSKLANSNSRTIQSVSGAVGVLLSTMWIAYFGKDAPPEVYAAIPLVVMAIQQAFATHINTRK